MTDSKRLPTRDWPSIPKPIRRVFDQFPYVSYEENSSPQRANRPDGHRLYVFDNPFAASTLSCNPACLKWQVYLRFNDVDFKTVTSNNHASPSGSLPFLLPAPSADDPHPVPLTTGKLARWVSQQTMQEEDHYDVKHEAYMSLIDHDVRNAWLYHLYIQKSNFGAVARPLYVATASSNRFVQMAIAHQLRQAAETELLKTRRVIDTQEIYTWATKAFRSLETLLGDAQVFSADGQPDLFDASVFAYTHLLLDESLPWTDTILSDILRDHPRLVAHRQHLLDVYLKD